MGTKALIFEIVGVDRASQTFGKVSAAVTESTTNMEKLQRAGAIAGKALLIGGAAAAVGLVYATKAAADDQAAQSQLAKQLKTAAGASDEQVAATEAWITAQGKATGITDDELRPALAKLATATGDVDKAQRLAQKAQSIAIGSGKSYEQVTTALAKAQNGNLGALGRLGIATKDASGHTKTLSQITQDLTDKYKGSAGKAAETAAGKQKILSTQVHELVEQIGTGLLPVMSKIVDALIKATDWMSKHTKVVGIAIGIVAGLAAALWLVSTATWAVNVALDANPIGLIILAIAALVVGLIYAYKHFDKFRAAVDATFGFLKRFVPPVIKFVVDFIKNHWQLLLTIMVGPIALVAIQVVKHFDTIKRIATVVVGAVIDTAKGYARFATAVIDKVGDVVKFFKNLPGKITGFLTGLPGQLATIGGQIIQGLVNGIQAAAGKVYSVVQSIIDKIPKKIRQIMGISSPSKVTAKLGYDIGDGLAVGMERSSGKVEDAAKKLADKLKSKLASLLDARSGLASSVAGNFTGSLFSASAQAAVLDENGNVVTPAQTVGQNFLSNLGSTSGQLSQLIPAFKQLRKWGWKPGMLAALFQSGGADLIIELASNQGEATQAQSLLGGIGTMSNHLGNLVGENQYGDQINATKHKLHGKGKGGKGGDDTNARTGDTYNVTMNVPPNADTNAIARETVKMIKRYKREINGNQELGIA